MEFCAASLEKLYLKESEYCIPAEEIIFQLAKGLEYIHSKELVHRDLKPNNALVWMGPGDGNDIKGKIVIKWADFGLSKRTSPNGSYSISEIQGALKWLAPEMFQMKNQWNNPRKEKNMRKGTTMSDVFSEGLTFAYILLGGVHPDRETLEDDPFSYMINRKSINLESQYTVYIPFISHFHLSETRKIW